MATKMYRARRTIGVSTNVGNMVDPSLYWSAL